MLSENKVLVIVYDFPPEIGGGGVMRTVKLVKYLPSFGWRPVVLTVERKDCWMPDNELLNEITGIDVYRCSDMIGKYNTNNSAGGNGIPNGTAPKQSPIRSLLSHLKNILKNTLIPDRRVGWLLPAIMCGIKIIKNNKIDLVYATAPPHTPLLVGYILSILTGKKLVVDYRDAWVGNELFTNKYKYHNVINGWLERIILRKADLIVTTTEKIGDDLRAKTSNPIVTIPNGYDPEDFIGIRPLLLKSNKINFVYLGGFAGFRTSYYFVEALNNLEDKIKKAISIYFVGKNSDEEISFLESVNDIDIEICGSLPHKEALRYLISSDILILFIFKEEDSKSAIPGKIYEYLAAKKPIIAFCEKDSALANLLYGFGVQYIVKPDNIEEIASTLSKIVNDFGKTTIDYDCRYFDRKDNTRILSGYFNKILRET